MKLIAETAWHHEGDFEFMRNLVTGIVEESKADIVKMHITLDWDEYMHPDHQLYKKLREWLFTEKQWSQLIEIVIRSDKELMLLLNDTWAVQFAMEFRPKLIELHSVCLNNVFLINKLKPSLTPDMQVILGVGGTALEELDHAIRYFDHPNTVLMFGFQNYPTRYEYVNLSKMRRVMRLYPEMQFGYADHTAWNESNNELITLLVAANGMDYVEKHVTTAYGTDRTDSAAAISIEMLNSLAETLKLLEAIDGDGQLQLNPGERNYSVFGPMKMAAVAARNVDAGEKLSLEDLCFKRTGQTADLSQLEVLNMVGGTVQEPIMEGCVLMRRNVEQP
jgi:N,N'-diacetyllegionaminate synthase